MLTRPGCALCLSDACADLDTGKPHDPNAESLATRYDLLANITHEGLPGPGKGVYKIHLLNKVRRARAHGGRAFDCG